MGRFVILALFLNILVFRAFAQDLYILSGTIADENNRPLPGASVYISSLSKGVITDDQGDYKIMGLNKGSYRIEISFMGYQTMVDTILMNGNKVLNARLHYTPLSLQEVIVTNSYAETRKKEQSLSVEVVNQDYLKQNMGGSLMKSIERLPGITAIDIGSGQSKPVIRGLGFNRVVVVENGIKHEGQQWGADHGLEIDQYAVDNLEVIKGPASLMYGSDAIGGVIDVKYNKVPEDNFVGGTVDLIAKSNNNLGGTSLSLSARGKWFFIILHATLIDYGDFKVPTDSVDIYSYKAALYNNQLRNTAGREKNFHVTLGMVKTKFKSRFYISNVHTRSGFFANAHGLEPRYVDAGVHDESDRDILYPYQEVNHFKLINMNQWLWNKLVLETDLGFQRNFREEWSQYVSHGYMPSSQPGDVNFNPDLERQFDKYIYSVNLKSTYKPNEKIQLSVGLTNDYQDNRINGRGFIIPAYKQLNAGGFVFARYLFSGNSTLQLGARYDYGNITTAGYYDWFRSPVVHDNDTVFEYLQRADDLERSFSSISWSAGYNYHNEKWLMKVNAGKSFRIPIAKELAANGVNYHRFSYEKGNPDLSSEISYQLDAGMEYNSKKFSIGVSPFVNYFTNYIYLNPEDHFDRLYGAGNQVFSYTQSEVFRYGGEIHAHYQLVKHIQLGIIGEYVYSEQLSGEKKGFTLPFAPPASAIFNVKYRKTKLFFIRDAYVSVDYRLTMAQNNIVPPEVTTDGYGVIHIGVGGSIKLKQQMLDFSVQVQNLLNNKYFNHTSYYRLINVPEPERNFILNISIPFSGKIKNK